MFSLSDGGVLYAKNHLNHFGIKSTTITTYIHVFRNTFDSIFGYFFFGEHIFSSSLCAKLWSSIWFYFILFDSANHSSILSLFSPIPQPVHVVFDTLSFVCFCWNKVFISICIWFRFHLDFATSGPKSIVFWIFVATFVTMICYARCLRTNLKNDTTNGAFVNQNNSFQCSLIK